MANFMLWDMIHLDLSFGHSNKYGSFFILQYVDILLFQHHLLNMLLFFHLIFCFFVKNQMLKYMWIDIWVFCSVSLVLLFVLLPIPGSFQHCSSVIEFEVRDYDGSRSFILQDCFGYTLFYAFPYVVEYCFSRSVKNFAGILMSIALNL